MIETTDGSLLGGRVRYRQPRAGFRSGIEPVLLAASVPAGAGERVLEAGCGAGAALLCLAARVPGAEGLGVERDPALAEIARANVAANGFDRLRIVTGDIGEFRAPAPFDHAIANPPYHPPDGTASPLVLREAAKRATADLLCRWTRALAAALRHRGTLTLCLPAAAIGAALPALAAAGCGAPTVLPLWPRAGQSAKLVLLRGVKGSRGVLRLLPGLTLHAAAGSGFTPDAEAVLRLAAALALYGRG